MDKSALLMLVLKFVHVLAAIMFVGNAALGPYRRKRARLTGNATIIAGAYAIHTESGPIVTVPWFATGVVSGIALAWVNGIPIATTGWIVWSLLSTLLVALLFVLAIAPLQRQATTAAGLMAEVDSNENRRSFEAAAKKLEPFSHVAHVTFALIILLMVAKPPLPVPW